MTTAEWTTHIDRSIARAVSHDSAIDQWVLGITGFSTGVMRRLVSNLVQRGQVTEYLEIGCYGGATACAALNNNKLIQGHLFENQSQAFGNEVIWGELMANLERAKETSTGLVRFMPVDWFNDGPERIQRPIHVAFYDGEHSTEAQRRAVSTIVPLLSDPGLLMIDDASWETVKDGTKLGFQDVQKTHKIAREWNLRGQREHDDPVWWNGVNLYLIEKCHTS